MKSKRTKMSRVKNKAQIIIRQRYNINATGKKEFATPVIHILATRKGFRFLANFFQALAETKIPQQSADSDPDNHAHLSTGQNAVFDPSLSDELEFRVGLITPSNRKRTLKKYTINRATRADKDLINRYEKQVAEIKKYLADQSH